MVIIANYKMSPPAEFSKALVANTAKQVGLFKMASVKLASI